MSSGRSQVFRMAIIYLSIQSPWCYIATLELRKAIARAYINQLPLLFRIEYKPFELNAVISGMSEQAQKGISER